MLPHELTASLRITNVEATNNEAFRETLKKSRLLSPEQLAEVETRFAAEAGLTPPRLAKDLIARGLLSEWQARQLLAGRYGFFMGKYKLLERLGGGGMGVVFKAHHPMTDRTVALKVMAKSLMANPANAARFQREVRLVCALNHPNIITAYDADCAAGTYFLVMEYGQGRDLRAWLREYGRLPIAWSCECVRQAALALQHAHERGLVHRDIKPENLLVDGDPASGRPVVKILDMGLARLMDDESCEDAQLASGGQLVGTPDYVAPEQAEDNRKADIRSDIFSLGCTLFRLLTGEPAFPGDDAVQKLMARLMRDAPPVSRLREDVPAELDEIVARMVARAPDDRYQTPAEVAAALAPFAAEEQTAVALPRLHIPAEEIKYEEAVSAVDVAVETFLTRLANQEDAEVASMDAARISTPPMTPARQRTPPPPLPAAVIAKSTAQASKPAAQVSKSAAAAKTKRSAAVATLPKAEFLPPAVVTTPPMVTSPPDLSSPPLSSSPPAAAGNSPPSSGAPRSRRANYGNKNLIVGVAMGVLISVPVIGLLMWPRRPPTLVIDWRMDERKGAGLNIDYRPVDLPKTNPATIMLTPGKHRVVVQRRGDYDPIEWKITIGRGERIERKVEWKKRGSGSSKP